MVGKLKPETPAVNHNVRVGEVDPTQCLHLDPGLPRTGGGRVTAGRALERLPKEGRRGGQ